MFWTSYRLFFYRDHDEVFDVGQHPCSKRHQSNEVLPFFRNRQWLWPWRVALKKEKFVMLVERFQRWFWRVKLLYWTTLAPRKLWLFFIFTNTSPLARVELNRARRSWNWRNLSERLWREMVFFDLFSRFQITTSKLHHSTHLRPCGCPFFTIVDRWRNIFTYLRTKARVSSLDLSIHKGGLWIVKIDCHWSDDGEELVSVR